MTTDFHKRIAALSPEKRALLEKRLQARQPAAPQGALIPRRRAEGECPLSFAQQRLWFLDQLGLGGPIYTLPAAVQLSGRLDLGALQRSLDAIIARHEVLRTTFAAVDGRPVQVIGPVRGSAAVPLRVIDLRALPRDAREAQIQRLAIAEARHVFDLARGPLVQAMLLRMAAQEHVVHVTMHHIVSDGWSSSVFIREIAALYEAFASGRPVPLPDLQLQYADFAIWQREWLQGAVLEAQLAYWRERLGARPPALALPIDHPRPAVQSFRGARLTALLPPALTRAIKALGEQAGATPFMTLLAALKTLFYHYTGQRDIVIGSTIANRNHPGTEELIGFFVNTLVLRTDLSGAPTFRQLLGRVREVTLGAYDHQDLPFEQLVEALAPQRDLSQTPLVQMMFDFDNTPASALMLPGLTLTPLPIERGIVHFDLTLSVADAPQGLAATWEYSTDLFEPDMIARLARSFQTLLQNIVADPARRLRDLALLTEAERRQLLVEWNPAAPDEPISACIHELVEAQAAYTPDAVAVVFVTNDERRMTNDQRPTTNGAASSSIVHHPSSAIHLTYRELDRRANQLAHFLRSRGVGPEQLVGICVERSLELAVGILGALKAGAGYLPLDPAYPAERLAFMMQDSVASVVIMATDELSDKETRRQGDKEIDSLLVSPSPALLVSQTVVDLRADWAQIARLPATSPASGVCPGNLAYVIYTSGSTGRPKGALISHEALVNYTLAAVGEFGLRADDRMLQFASLGFDVVAEELFPVWARGGAVVLHEGAQLLPIGDFTRLLDQARVTVVELPAAYWHVWVDELARGAPLPGALRLVLLGCEKPSPDRLASWQRLGVPLIYVFGLTETTITSTLYRVPGDTAGKLGRAELPIGRPIRRTQAYVLNPQLQPVPIGVPGELYIGGAGLARGYLGRPDLTAARFIPNPFARTIDDGRWTMNESSPSSIVYRLSSETRLYRTGDLARYLPDSNIEFLGRLDQQVKLRGYRIEPGEIEAALGEHPAVREAVVALREDRPDDRRLVAYVVPIESTTDDRRLTIDDRRGSDPSSIVHRPSSSNEEGSDSSFVLRPSSFVTELRGFLAARLPDYMVPAAFVLLDALPLTTNGKVDRAALPPPDGATPESEERFVAPHSLVEQTLAEIWGDVLGLAQVGVYDNFFEIGGDSILSIQIISRANQAGIHLTPMQMFQHPTIAELAGVAGTAPLMLAEQGPVTGPLPLTPIQRWFFEQDLPDPHHWNMAILFELQQTFEPAILRRVLRELLRHHDALRLRFARTEDGWRQSIAAPDASAPLLRIDVSALPGAQQSRAIETVAARLQTSLGLARGPLLRGIFFDGGAQRADRLLVVTHHLAVDSISWRILLEDLQTAYQQLSQGAPVRLPRKTTSFKHWSLRLGEYVQSAELAHELDYWLAEPRARARSLPVDHPAGVGRNSVASARSITTWLGADETRALLHSVPSVYNTKINDVLLAALAQTIAGWTGENALLVDLESHGRESIFEELDLSRTVGWFAAVFPVLLELGAAGDPGAALRQVKEQLRGIPRGGIGYGALRYLGERAEARRLADIPQAQISFNYLGQFDQVLPPSSPFTLAPEDVGPTESPLGARPYLLDLRGYVAGGRLQMIWTYSEHVHRRETIERLAERYVEALRALIAHCQSPEAGGYTPSDFPKAKLSQLELDQFIAQIASLEEL